MGTKWEGSQLRIVQKWAEFPLISQLISHKVVQHIVIKPGANVISTEKHWGTVFFLMDPGMAMVRVRIEL